MRKKIGGLLLVFISLAAASCSNDQYTIERQYYTAQKRAEKIFRNPLATAPNELQKVVATFGDFAQKFPQTNLAIEAKFVIARLYMVKEEYEKSRSQLQAIIKEYAKFPDICSEAAFLTGSSYELGEKWQEALKQYKKTIQDYPATRKSLELPIYIARYYKTKFQPDKMIAAYQEAISHYQMLTEKYPHSLLAYTAHTLMARCYMAIKDWRGAIDVLETMLQQYKGKRVSMDGLLLNMALIYTKELKDTAKAKGILETLIKDYPKSRLIKAANKLFEEINKK